MKDEMTRFILWPSSFILFSMAYVALYRKYRSQNFGELMGQEAVTTTLQNAIRSGRIAHAYLFHGARGCGKTSTARLLARALNCVAQDAPTPEPCGVCRLCVSIRDGSCLDVVEIDAASETSIDDVREKIIENVQYAPAEGRYKVYIIDEVHDLSAKAFDALLKTLEEPPPHVVFILATTELHKVPITIKSRCQHHQFKRGSLPDLAAAVQRVLTGEGWTAEPEAVQAIARAAEGSWRDALSLLEQVMAYAEGHLTAEAVHRAIGSVGTDRLLTVTETLAQSDWAATLAVTGELLESGADARQLLTSLSGHLRDLLLVRVAPQAASQEMGAERLALLAPQSRLFEPPALLAMMSELSRAERELRFTNQHRWLLERTLLRLQLGAASGQWPVASEEERPSSPLALPGTRHTGRGDPTEESIANRKPKIGNLPPLPTVVPKPPAPTRGIEAIALSEDAESDLAETQEEPDTASPIVPAAAVSDSALPSGVSQQQSAVKPEERPALEESRFAEAITLPVVRRAWPRFLKEIERSAPQGLAYLSKAEPVALDGNYLVLAFATSFARDRVQNNTKGRERVEKILNKTLQTEGYRVRCILAEPEGEEPSGVANGTQSSAPTASSTSMQETAALLDVPVATTATATRIADFDMVSAPLPSDSQPASERAAPASQSPLPPEPEPEPPPSSGFLAETLSIFGGEVIHSERL